MLKAIHAQESRDAADERRERLSMTYELPR